MAQLADREHPVRLVGIEEPETVLHPAASGALMDALREAAIHTQIIVTSHSPDFLDQIDTEEDELLVVESRDGTTVIADAGSSSLEMIKSDLYTPGELLRMQVAFGASGSFRAIPTITAVAAEAARLVILHYDSDFETIAEVTRQPVEWVVGRGSV